MPTQSLHAASGERRGRRHLGLLHPGMCGNQGSWPWSPEAPLAQPAPTRDCRAEEASLQSPGHEWDTPLPAPQSRFTRVPKRGSLEGDWRKTAHPRSPKTIERSRQRSPAVTSTRLISNQRDAIPTQDPRRDRSGSLPALSAHKKADAVVGRAIARESSWVGQRSHHGMCPGPWIFVAQKRIYFVCGLIKVHFFNFRGPDAWV